MPVVPWRVRCSRVHALSPRETVAGHCFGPRGQADAGRGSRGQDGSPAATSAVVDSARHPRHRRRPPAAVVGGIDAARRRASSSGARTGASRARATRAAAPCVGADRLTGPNVLAAFAPRSHAPAAVGAARRPGRCPLRRRGAALPRATLRRWPRRGERGAPSRASRPHVRCRFGPGRAGHDTPAATAGAGHSSSIDSSVRPDFVKQHPGASRPPRPHDRATPCGIAPSLAPQGDRPLRVPNGAADVHRTRHLRGIADAPLSALPGKSICGRGRTRNRQRIRPPGVPRRARDQERR